jgi:hypothetical protein
MMENDKFSIRYHTRSIYTAAHVYQQLLNQPQLKEGETGANLCEKFHTLDKKLSELNDKSSTCSTITEGLLLHLAIKAIPAHWNITAGIVSQPDITMAAITRAVDQYRLLKSGRSVTGNVTHQRVNSVTTVARGHAPFAKTGHKNNYKNKNRFTPRSDGSGYQGHNPNTNQNSANNRSSNSSSDSSYSSYNNLNRRTGNTHTSFVFQAQPLTDERDSEDNDNDNDDDNEIAIHGSSTAATESTPTGVALSSDGTLKRIDQDWILDSGASLHVTGSNYIKNVKIGPPMRIRYANGVVTDVHKYGVINLTSSVTLHNVAVVKNGVNLISLARILDSGCSVRFGVSRAIVKDRRGDDILTFHRGKESALWIYKCDGGTESLDHTQSIIKRRYVSTIPKRNTNANSISSSSSAAGNDRTQLNRSHLNRNGAGTTSSSSSSSASSSSAHVPAPGAHYVHSSRRNTNLNNNHSTGMKQGRKRVHFSNANGD